MEKEEKSDRDDTEQCKVEDEARHSSSSHLLAMELMKTSGSTSVEKQTELKSEKGSNMANQEEVKVKLEPMEKPPLSCDPTHQQDSLPVITAVMSLKEVATEPRDIPETSEIANPISSCLIPVKPIPILPKSVYVLKTGDATVPRTLSHDTTKYTSILANNSLQSKQGVVVSLSPDMKCLVQQTPKASVTSVLLPNKTGVSRVMSNCVNTLATSSSSGSNTTLVSATRPSLSTVTSKVTNNTTSGKVNLNSHLPVIYVKKLGNTSGVKSAETSSVKSKTIDLSTVNIDSVPVNKLLELFSRRNPSPAYKPEMTYTNSSELRKIHACLECGDMFLFETSLSAHKQRHSMEIDYHCMWCGRKLLFYNKCSFMAHLRSHRNIKKVNEQIHIKSQSLAIKPLEYKKTSKCDKDNCSTCTECGKENLEGPHTHMSEHFDPKSNNLTTLQSCILCQMTLPSSCSFSAHKRLHEQAEKYVCPECGKCFKTHATEFMIHLTTECFHLSRVIALMCFLCPKVLPSERTFIDHIMNKHLQIFHKCEACNIVFLTHSGFMKHSSSDKNQKCCDNYKDLYKCMFKECGLTIESKLKMRTHLSDHFVNLQGEKRWGFLCISCYTVFDSKSELNQHYAIHRQKKAKFHVCVFCNEMFSSKEAVIIHYFLKHNKLPGDVIYCDKCNCNFVSEENRQYHICAVKEHDGHSADVQSSVDLSVSADSADTDKSADAGSMKTLAYKSRDETGALMSKGNKSSQSETKFSITKVYPKASSERTLTENKSFKIEKSGQQNVPSKGKLNQRTVFTCKRCNYPFPSLEAFYNHASKCVGVTKSVLKSQNIAIKTGNGEKKMIKFPNISKKSAYTIRSPTYKLPLKILNEPRVIHDELDTSEPDEELPGVSSTSDDTVITPKLHQCLICGDLLPGKLDLKSHEEEHKRQFFPCHLCSSIYTTSSDLQSHFKQVHEGKRDLLQCSICKKRNITKLFSSHQFLEKHISIKHKNRCSKNMKRSNVSSSDELSSPDTLQSSIIHDGKQARPAKQLHIQGDQTYVCAKCGYQSEKACEFYVHIKTHSMANTVQCYDCGLCFSVLPALKRHLFIVHKIKDFQSYCKFHDIHEPEDDKEQFDEEILIVDALKTSTPNVPSCSKNDDENIDSLQCKVCKRNFEDDASLKSHMRSHGLLFLRSKRRHQSLSASGDTNEQTPNKKIKVKEEVKTQETMTNLQSSNEEEEEDPVSLQCNVCHNMFIDGPSLKSHMLHCSFDQSLTSYLAHSGDDSGGVCS